MKGFPRWIRQSPQAAADEQVRNLSTALLAEALSSQHSTPAEVSVRICVSFADHGRHSREVEKGAESS